MADPPVSYDFGYVHTDIPEGMTIREWRRERAADRAGARQATRQLRRRRLLATPVRGWIAARRVPLRTTSERSWLAGREARG
jgi:hypothetical protein